MRLNYNHLYYFWEVVRQGGVVPAAEALDLTPQTISGQLKQFQSNFPEPLLQRAGRRLRLTLLGEQVFEHAQTMFAEVEALSMLADEGEAGTVRRLRIGAADAMPKMAVRALLEPALRQTPAPRLSVRELDLASLLEDLAHRRLDAVLADRPAASAGWARARSTLLETTELAIYVHPSLRGRLNGPFPDCLDGAPALLPGQSSYARRLLDQWLHHNGIRPEIVAEVDDSALMKSFGEAGFGFFTAPANHAPDIERQYGAIRLGSCKGVEERFYAITLDNVPPNADLSRWLGRFTGTD
ncbi:LysR family transcriptional regulator [Ectothiorhodospiraceae bacterium WFHF3C12]|nr:LysR family transcriptional regulator [Ectothiorhodospiraceae bacterium WFHF3C12]